MDYAASFARFLGRLVYLLVHDPANLDEQKGSLRAMLTLSREGAIVLAADGDTLTANDTPLPSLLAGVSEVAVRLRSLGVQWLEVDAGASAGELLGAARVLAGVPQEGAHMTGVTVRFGVSAGLAEEEPAASPVTHVTEPEGGAPAAPAAEAPAPMVEESAVERLPVEEPIVQSSMADDHDGPARPAAPPVVDATTDELLDELDRTESADRLAVLLDALAGRAEAALDAGDATLVSGILHRVVRREEDLLDVSAKRAIFVALRRLGTPSMLRAVATCLPRAPESRAELLAVLARSGETGAEVVIEQHAAAASDEERRLWTDALRGLPAAVSVLLHQLADPRWDVARAAAALLGELRAPQAERPLAEASHHDDERVRHAATTALMRLGTPRSVPAIERTLRDRAPQMRIQAAAELVVRGEQEGARQLLRALEEEQDDEVRAAFLIALGRLATTEAVERLIAEARPARGLFRKRPVAIRVAAVQALGEARTTEAVRALRELRDDREADVRAVATYALRRATAR